MEARELSSAEVTPIQLSLRIRHPSIDPEEISRSFGLKPEHSFKAGAPRGPRSSGHHTQTYWLARVSMDSGSDPFEPSFLATIASRSGRTVSLSAEAWQKVTENLRVRSPELMMLYFLNRLNSQQPFLQQVQREGGDASLILLMERESSADFTLPPSVSRLLVELSISVEFQFV
jgi:hypothetical protein